MNFLKRMWMGFTGKAGFVDEAMENEKEEESKMRMKNENLR